MRRILFVVMGFFFAVSISLCKSERDGHVYIRKLLSLQHPRLAITCELTIIMSQTSRLGETDPEIVFN